MKSHPKSDTSKQLESKLRRSLMLTYQRLYTLGFGVGNDGNGSARINSTQILITPRGVDKARMTPKDMVRMELSGRVFKSGQLPSSEHLMHLEIFHTRPDVKAIIHSHAPYATALSFSKLTLTENYLPELMLALGPVPTVAYAPTGTQSLATAVGVAIKSPQVCALLLERHGVLAVGDSPEAALQRLERLEHGCKILLLAASSFGALSPLKET